MKFLMLSLFLSLCYLSPAFATDLEEVAEKGKSMAKEISNDTKRAAKNVSRKVKEQKCKLENKNMDCLGMKAKHAIQKGADEVEDALD